MNTLEQVKTEIKQLTRKADYSFIRNLNDVLGFCEFSFDNYDGPVPGESQKEIDTYMQDNSKEKKDLRIISPGNYHKICTQVRESQLAQLKDPVVFDLQDGVATIVSIWDERGRLANLSDLLI